MRCHSIGSAPIKISGKWTTPGMCRGALDKRSDDLERGIGLAKTAATILVVNLHDDRVDKPV
jgi:hypothetical protein